MQIMQGYSPRKIKIIPVQCCFKQNPANDKLYQYKGYDMENFMFDCFVDCFPEVAETFNA